MIKTTIIIILVLLSLVFDEKPASELLKAFAFILGIINANKYGGYGFKPKKPSDLYQKQKDKE